MRNTVHLVTAEDYVSFRPLFQPKLDCELAWPLSGGDVDAISAECGALLEFAAPGPSPEMFSSRLSARIVRFNKRPPSPGRPVGELR
jgi:hypothetical protein